MYWHHYAANMHKLAVYIYSQIVIRLARLYVLNLILKFLVKICSLLYFNVIKIIISESKNSKQRGLSKSSLIPI